MMTFADELRANSAATKEKMFAYYPRELQSLKNALVYRVQDVSHRELQTYIYFYISWNQTQYLDDLVEYAEELGLKVGVGSRGDDVILKLDWGDS